MRPFRENEYGKMLFSLEQPIHEIMAQRYQVITSSGRPKLGLCRNFINGNCHRGSQCTFTHAANVKSEVCKHWLRGLCKKNDECDFLHVFDLSRMATCTFFAQSGHCINEDTCLFRHIRATQAVGECQGYTRGFCKDGPNCAYTHTRRELCLDYMAGFCQKGPSCELAHPRHEMTERLNVCSLCGMIGHVSENCSRNLLNLAPSSSSSHPSSSSSSSYSGGSSYQQHQRGQHQGGGGQRRTYKRDLSKIRCFNCGQFGHFPKQVGRPTSVCVCVCVCVCPFHVQLFTCLLISHLISSLS
jgi:hypothetical protein